MRLLDSARDHLRQLLGVVQTRLELVGLELADARDHLVALLIYAAASVFFIVMTVIAGLAWLLIAYWEQRLMIIGGATVLFALLTIVAIWRAVRHAQSGGDIFADSLQALQTDRAALRPPTTDATSIPAPRDATSNAGTSHYVGD
jgi:uncharacterized membrane protein YqjE